MQLFIALADALVGNIVDALDAVAVVVPLLCIRSVVALLLELIWFQFFFYFYALPVAGCLNVALGSKRKSQLAWGCLGIRGAELARHRVYK